MDWRTFKLLNATERAWLARGVRAAAVDWLTAWLPGTAPGPVQCLDASERASSRLAREPLRWVGCAHRDAVLSMALDRDLEQALVRHLFGCDARGALVGDVTTAALADLGQRLLGGAAGSEPAAPSARPPAPESWRRGAGAAIVEIDVAGAVLALLASPEWVAARLAARPRPAAAPRAEPIDPRQCIGHADVRVQVWAGSASLELGLLHTLAVGDVIRLDSTIEQALRITVQGRDSERRAFLGQLEGRRAVQLTAPPH